MSDSEMFFAYIEAIERYTKAAYSARRTGDFKALSDEMHRIESTATRLREWANEQMAAAAAKPVKSDKPKRCTAGLLKRDAYGEIWIPAIDSVAYPDPQYQRATPEQAEHLARHLLAMRERGERP